MFCYVGKATKIFFCVISVAAVAGLIIGIGVLRHRGAGPHSKGGVDSNNGPSTIPYQPTPPIPTAPPPLQSPPASTPLGPIAP